MFRIEIRIHYGHDFRFSCRQFQNCFLWSSSPVQSTESAVPVEVMYAVTIKFEQGWPGLDLENGEGVPATNLPKLS